jgi:glutamate synthase (NADPH/NADH) large chain
MEQLVTAVRAHMSVRNVNRTVGTMLGHEMSERGIEVQRFAGGHDQPHLHGLCWTILRRLPCLTAITLRLEGDVNDYVGKGLSGGRIAVSPPTALQPFVARKRT